MDIHSWLAHADLHRAPDGPLGRHSKISESRDGPTSPLPQAKAGPRKSLADRHRRASSHNKRQHRRHSPSAQEDTSLSSSSSSASSTSHPPSSELYKRRKRHKTREGLYESHSGVRKKRSRPKKEGHRADKKKPKTKHHRTVKPSKAVKPGQKLLKGFKADNVGSSRLILHSPKKQAFFTHGKASSPQRTRGLPDLRFSEMRFLSRPIDSSDHSEQHRHSQSKKRQNKAQDDEAISTFFSGKRVPLAERDSNIQSVARSKDKPEDPRSPDEHGRDKDPMVTRRSPPGHSARPQPAKVRPTSETQFSWSASEREPRKACREDETPRKQDNSEPPSQDVATCGEKSFGVGKPQPHTRGKEQSTSRSTVAGDEQQISHAQKTDKDQRRRTKENDQATGPAIAQAVGSTEPLKVNKDTTVPASKLQSKSPESSPFSKLLHACAQAMAQQTPRREDQQPWPRPMAEQHFDKHTGTQQGHQQHPRQSYSREADAPDARLQYDAMRPLDSNHDPVYNQERGGESRRYPICRDGQVVDPHQQPPYTPQEPRHLSSRLYNSRTSHNPGFFREGGDATLGPEQYTSVHGACPGWPVRRNPQHSAPYHDLSAGEHDGLPDYHEQPYGTRRIGHHQYAGMDPMRSAYQHDYRMHDGLDVGDDNAADYYDYEDLLDDQQYDGGWGEDARFDELAELLPSRRARAAEEETPGSRVVPAGFWRANRLY